MSAHSNLSGNSLSIEQANKMLPLVRAITTDLVQLWKCVADKRERLSVILSRRDMGPSDPYSDELAGIKRGLQDEVRQIQGFVRELRQLGVEPRGPEGYVDFPSSMDGQRIYLSWKLGEPEILFWRLIKTEIDDRKQLAQAAGVGEFDQHDSWK